MITLDSFAFPPSCNGLRWSDEFGWTPVSDETEYSLVGALADGQLGAVTLARVDREPLSDLISRYTTARISYYRGLKTWWRYGKGWTRRARAAEVRTSSRFWQSHD